MLAIVFHRTLAAVGCLYKPSKGRELTRDNERPAEGNCLKEKSCEWKEEMELSLHIKEKLHSHVCEPQVPFVKCNLKGGDAHYRTSSTEKTVTGIYKSSRMFGVSS